MEDGTVSIFGLVFGIAAGAANGRMVLLAGAIGAASAAVSMMAGTFLEVSTERDAARAKIAAEQAEIAQRPAAVAAEVHEQLLDAGFTAADAQTVLTIMQRTPNALRREEIAFKLKDVATADQNPWIQAAWMFATDAFAGLVPVVPFAMLPLATARAVSLVVTAALLLGLGIGRGLIARKNALVTALQTLGIGAAAGAIGLLVGKLLTTGV